MIGEQLGSFRIEAVLGTGAMGVVYRAMNDVTGRLAAVKVISSGVAQKGKLHERFKREAEILQQFRHPNIVRFLALGRFKGTSYFAMEYVPGENMEQLLQRRARSPARGGRPGHPALRRAALRRTSTAWSTATSSLRT